MRPGLRRGGSSAVGGWCPYAFFVEVVAFGAYWLYLKSDLILKSLQGDMTPTLREVRRSLVDSPRRT